ncbi:MAG: Zinc ribbon domain protein [Candidatus Latescibacteria bacterium ADurb.Bin168]|nr:MAG: Zinc ribbon domain protein [Candidatus Latescibacteria bacterium ADurb.Bin168]
MPIFEYHCDSCGADFERLIFDRSEPVACDCGNKNVKKKLSVFAAQANAGASSSKAAACDSCCMAGGGSCALKN